MRPRSIWGILFLLISQSALATDPVSPVAVDLATQVVVTDGPDGVDYTLSWKGCETKLRVNKVDKPGATRNGVLTLCDRAIRGIQPPLLALFKKDRQTATAPIYSLTCPTNLTAREDLIRTLLTHSDWDAATGTIKGTEALNSFVGRIYGLSKGYRDTVEILLKAGYVARAVTIEKVFATNVAELRSVGVPLKGLDAGKKVLEPSMCTLTLDNLK